MFHPRKSGKERKPMIIQATQTHVKVTADLAILLWPGNTIDEMVIEMEKIILSDIGAIFRAFEENISVGFAQVQLRTDYVEGTSTRPVGYLEGLFVKEGFRHNGIARLLVDHSQIWAKGKGCSEFASDCELDNLVSLEGHKKLGFSVANRIICFTKKLI